MKIVNFLFYLIQFIIGIHLIFPILLYGIFKIRKGFSSKVRLGTTEFGRPVDYAIIVTAYQQTDQLPEAVGSLLKMRYPQYHIYVVADNCDISSLSIDDPKVLILRPEQVLASNTKSHFYAIRHFIRPHDRLVIIDSDNLAHPDLLNQLSTCFDHGFLAVQGTRLAKNLDTDLARLDAARDIYYHFYDGKVLFGAGSSATLAGSGMAFQTALYRECLEHLSIEGAGFDKVLQAEIIRRGHRIAFAPEAIVYDEKTTASQQLVGQRARWINTWFKYFGFGFDIFGKGLLRFNWNQILFGIVLLRPPLFIFLLLSVLLGAINIFFSPLVAIVWLVGLLLFVFGFGLSLVLSDTDRRIYSSLTKVPQFVFYQLAALLKVRKANKISVATRHGSGTPQSDS